MLEKEKQNNLFSFFKSKKKEEHISKKIFNITIYGLFNMIKWNIITMIVLILTIQVEKKRVEDNKIYLADMNNFNKKLIDIIKSNKFKTIKDIENAIKENRQDISSTLVTNNLIEFVKTERYKANHYFIINIDNLKKTLYIKDSSPDIKNSIKNIEKEGNIIVSESYSNLNGKTLIINAK